MPIGRPLPDGRRFPSTDRSALVAFAKIDGRGDFEGGDEGKCERADADPAASATADAAFTLNTCGAKGVCEGGADWRARADRGGRRKPDGKPP